MFPPCLLIRLFLFAEFYVSPEVGTNIFLVVGGQGLFPRAVHCLSLSQPLDLAIMELYAPPGSYSLPLLIGSLAVASVYFLYQFITLRITRRMLIKQSACKPPRKHPQKGFLLGLDTLRDAVHALRSKTFLIRLRRLYNENGNTFSMYSLASTSIYTIETENLKYVLSTNPKDFGITRTRKDAFGPFLGHNILAAEGAEWAKSRAFLRPSFARKQISDVERFEVHVNNLIGALRHDDGSTVDLKALFPCLTADITTDLMFGESINSLQSESFPGFMEAFQDAQFGCEDRARWGKLANFIPQPLFYKSVKLIHEYMDGHVERGLQYSLSSGAVEKVVETEGRYVLLKELRKVISDRRLLRDELLTIFFAGRDTTASLLCSTFFTLARRPDIWQQLRSEVAQLAGAKPTFTQLSQMSYAKNVLNESEPRILLHLLLSPISPSYRISYL